MGRKESRRYFNYLDGLGSHLKGLETDKEAHQGKSSYGKFPQIEETINKLLELNPTNSFAGRTKAAILLEQGHKDGASKVLVE